MRSDDFCASRHTQSLREKKNCSNPHICQHDYLMRLRGLRSASCNDLIGLIRIALQSRRSLESTSRLLNGIHRSMNTRRGNPFFCDTRSRSNSIKNPSNPRTQNAPSSAMPTQPNSIWATGTMGQSRPCPYLLPMYTTNTVRAHAPSRRQHLSSTSRHIRDYHQMRLSALSSS